MTRKLSVAESRNLRQFLGTLLSGAPRPVRRWGFAASKGRRCGSIEETDLQIPKRAVGFHHSLHGAGQMNRAYWLLPVMAAAVAAPCQAGVYGSLANFDVVNDTGSTAHGFEIDIDGIRSTDITSLFGAGARWPNMERYGAPTVSATGTGVKIVYQATYNGAWSAGTPSGRWAPRVMGRITLATILAYRRPWRRQT
jgi:hypothetical protein